MTIAATIERNRVLVIDDDPDVADFIRLILERRASSDVLVLCAANEVASAVAEFRPDVIVTDIEMPGMSGLDLIGVVHAFEPGLPVIVMTAHISAEYAIRALREQADEFLTKPVSSTDLVNAVVRLADARRQGQQDVLESDRAIEVQRGLLPAVPLDLPGYRMAGGCAPARAVGGDFFDWQTVPGGAAFTLADVMGKGIGPAILAATVRASLRTHASAADVAGAFAAAAAQLEPDLERAQSFVTLFHGVLDVGTHRMQYVDAGHGLTIVVRPDGTMVRLAATDPPLGVPGSLGGASRWKVHHVDLGPGDLLLSASDGLLDLYDGSLDALDRVRELVQTGGDPGSVVDAIVALTGENSPDDVTVLALQRHPGGNG